ncbi:Ku protein [Lacrimispora saccharolytica]|uniref:Non-homologous end joining protein Ku n=1 Tax=Lacrimispora saccharolytica (strain ATCC 35040 / DSM 2544 / NRCC 2533 / WM1) TaxID=610130 RepID=D9RAW3_LACSW|nr:Ku protein [Lacrimispora saccharolytica]ADL06160.1 Ku protein [[Clostridium] saccharolyticum WM1]QRV19729.1 Ku protein [Lacrimispora saccharolytica]
MAVAHKSAISVGLLYIPVGLYKTTKDISVSFNQLCKDTHERVKYQKICPSCNKEVSSDGIIKGYEYEKGKYVTFTEDELEKIKTKKDKTIHIEHFAKMSDVDEIYYEKNYYVVPEPGAEKACELLRQAMLSQKKVGIAKTVIGTTENLMVLYPAKDGIIAKTLFYQSEIQAVPVAVAKAEASQPEVEMAITMIDSMTATFDPSIYHDEYQERLRQAIESKIAGKEIVSADTEKQNNIIDLMEAMKKTVEMTRSNKGLA